MLLTNRLFFEQVEAMLAEGHEVQIRMKGHSMRPLLRNERDIAVLTPIAKYELSESGLITPKLTTPAEGDIPFPLGTDTIIVRVDDGSGTYVRYPVRVISNVVIVSSITIQSAGQSVEVENGKTFNLAQYVAINPSNATDKSVTYSSQDETVATVDPNGVITVIGEVGQATTITVTAMIEAKCQPLVE